MRRIILLLSTMALALLVPSGIAHADRTCVSSGSDVECTFSYTGAAQTWTVPDGVTQATFDVYGAQGGNVDRSGGRGGKASATIAVTPGETLQVNVGGAGGAGGFNGGAAGGSANSSGGGGGGASDIRTGAFALADRIIVAGGGGGAGGDNGGEGGAGGGIVGGDGNTAGGSFGDGQGGLGGSASSGGVGGAHGTIWVFAICTDGLNGTSGVGGVGGECSGEPNGGGGGGGGGYYGGGGGGGAVQGGGGGGGSGYVDPQASDVQFGTGVQSGNGLVTITYTGVSSGDNIAPQATTDAYSTDEDTTLTVDAPGVLSNDTDADDDPLRADVVDDVANGTLTLNADGSFTYTPNANFNGSDSFTYKANDGGADTIATTVSIQVNAINAINDAPSFTRGADQTVNEDAGAQSVSGWATNISAGPSDESGQAVSFVVTNNSNAALFAAGGQPSVDSDGVLTYTPAANASGSATVKVKATDNGGTANGGVNESAEQTFTITVNPVNDAPSFDVPDNAPVVNEDSGAQSVPGFASNISQGPANEAGQQLTFEVTNNTNKALFSVQPSLAPNGTLTYRPAADAFGSADVTVRLKDDGGRANGGVDTSAEQTFTITVTPVNDAPSVVLAEGGSCASVGGTMNLTVADVEGNLTLSATSSNSTLVPNTNISFSGSDQMRTMTVRPVEGHSGTAHIRITLSDRALKSTESVSVGVGTNGTDAINGTTRADMLFGLDGVDALNGLGSNDLMCGGKGVDALNGNSGDDTLGGGLGSDRFSGGTGTDTATDFSPSQGDTKDNTVETF